MTEYFSDVKFLPDQNNPTAIGFVPVQTAGAPPEDLRQFHRACDATMALINALFPVMDNRKATALQTLHLAAVTGAVGPNYDLAAGTDNLKAAQDTVADLARSVRSAYLRQLMLWVLGALPLLTLGIVVYFAARNGKPLFSLPGIGAFPPARLVVANVPGDFPAETALAIAVFWIPVGVVFGIVCEFILRTNNLTYESLANFDPGRWRLSERMFIVLMISVLVAVVVGTGIFEIGVVNRLLGDFLDKDPLMSLLIGFITGFAFPVMLDLMKRLSPEQKG